jgi:hypothetical protein
VISCDIEAEDILPPGPGTRTLFCVPVVAGIDVTDTPAGKYTLPNESVLNKAYIIYSALISLIYF